MQQGTASNNNASPFVVAVSGQAYEEAKAHRKP